MMTGRKVWMLVMAATVFLPSIATADTGAFQKKLNGFWIQEKVNVKGQKYTQPFAIQDRVWSGVYENWKNKDKKEKVIRLTKFSYFDLTDVKGEAATISFGDAKNDRIVTFLGPDVIEVKWLGSNSKEQQATRLVRHKGSLYSGLTEELKNLNQSSPDQIMKSVLKMQCMNMWQKVELKKQKAMLGKDYWKNTDYKKAEAAYYERSQTINSYGESAEPYFDMRNMRQVAQKIMMTVMENAKSSPPNAEVCNGLIDSVDAFSKNDVVYERVTGPKL